MPVRIPKALKVKLAAKKKPEPKVQMMIRIDQSLRMEFKSMCALHARDMQDVVADLMREEIRRDRLMREKSA